MSDNQCLLTVWIVHVNGNGGLNVININGNMTTSLILNGSATDIFIVNVTGTLSLT